MAGKRDRHSISLISTGAGILDVKITHQCNNLCRFCVAGDNRLIGKVPSEHEIRQCLTENAGQRKTVLFTGGEPTIMPALPALIQYARKTCGYRSVIIQTNGRRLAYKAYLEELIQAGASHFSISVHGHIPPLHDYLTRVEGSFLETLAGIRNALNHNVVLATNTVITKSNSINLADIAKLLGAMGVRQMQFAYPHLEGKALVNIENIAPPISLAAFHVKRALEAAGQSGALALTEGFPFCLLGEWKDHAVENIHTKRKVVDCQGDIEDFHGHRMSLLKNKGPACSACSMKNICEGPWADYPERFSWREFNPLP